MLKFQIGVWNTYFNDFDKPLNVTVIDDGSMVSPAEPIMRQNKCKLSTKLFRIEEDIKWNFSGARNLGCSLSDEWIYMSDIDTILEAEAVKRHLIDLERNKSCFYMTRRVLYETGVEVRPGSTNLLLHKSAFLEAGGYDEDYSGFYGKEDADFWRRLMRVSEKTVRNDVIARVVNSRVIPDATTSGLSRDTSRNNALFEARSKLGFPKPTNSLRFQWRRIF